MKKALSLILCAILVLSLTACGSDDSLIINKNGINEYDDMDYNLPSVFPSTLPNGARVVEFHYTYYRAYTSGEGYLEMTFTTADELDTFVNGYKQEMADKKADGTQLLEIVNPFDSGYVDFVEYTKKQDGSLFINNRFEKGVCSTNSKSISLNAQYTVMSYSYEEKTVIITYYSTAFFECPLDKLYPTYFRKFNVDIHEAFDYSDYVSANPNKIR